MAQSNNKTTPTFSEIIPTQIEVTELKDNDRSKGQRIAYIRNASDSSQVIFGLPWIHLKSYGIPGKAEYYKDDNSRSFIKLPLDENESNVKDLIAWTKSFDKYFGSDSYKEKLFGSKKDKYQYQPCFREPQEQEDDEENTKTKNKAYGPKLPYMKLKVDTTYPDNKIKTHVYKSVLENDKRVRTKVDDINSIDDLSKHLCFLSKARCYVSLSKLWAQTLKSSQTPKYGITFKLIKVEYEPRPQSNSSIQQFIESDIFLNDDEEVSTVMPPKPPPTNNKKIVQVDSDEESDDDPQPVKNVKKPINDDSESDDEQVTKVSPKAQVDDSDSDDEPVKVQTKMVVVDTDSDEEKPKKIVKKSTKSKKANA